MNTDLIKMIPKFRAWHREKEILAEVAEISWIYQSITVYRSWVDMDVYLKKPTEEWQFDEIDLESSIDRQDKNEVEIYKGDIITAGYQHDGVDNYDYDVAGRVAWDKQALQWVIISDTPGHSGEYPICSFEREELDEESVEIIGNIHEEASK